MDIKICSCCKESKTIDQFNKNKSCPDGLRYTCRACESAQGKVRYYKDIEETHRKNRAKGKLSHSRHREKFNAATRAWRLKNPESVLAANIAFRTSPEFAGYIREQQLRKNYGLTPEDYDRMYDEQGGKCAICKSDDHKGRKSVKYWPIDHCHTTGKIRGLLCFRCNSGLGNFKDDIDSLKQAIEYLEKHLEVREEAA